MKRLLWSFTCNTQQTWRNQRSSWTAQVWLSRSEGASHVPRNRTNIHVHVTQRSRKYWNTRTLIHARTREIIPAKYEIPSLAASLTGFDNILYICCIRLNIKNIIQQYTFILLPVWVRRVGVYMRVWPRLLRQTVRKKETKWRWQDKCILLVNLIVWSARFAFWCLFMIRIRCLQMLQLGECVVMYLIYVP